MHPTAGGVAHHAGSSRGGRVDPLIARRATARVAALLCATVALAGAVPLAAAAPAGGSRATPGDVDAAVSFRETLGFRADRRFVLDSFGKAGFSRARWGVPLDAAEAAEVARRSKVQNDAGPAMRKAASDPAFAGAY